MPTIYKRNCDYCGRYYERPGAKRFCSIQCVGKYHSDRKRYPNEPSKDELFNLYVNQKLGVYQIATKLNIPASCINRRMDKYQIPRRPQTLAQRVAVEQGRLKSGKDHPNWKGGRKYRKNGYNSLLRPCHPRACKGGYVQEHIIIWEEANEKSLPDGWVIHHINGVKNDNRIENLEAMPLRKHNSWLVMKAQAKRIRELESKLLEFEKLKNN